MGGKLPKGEVELWSYMCCGDGEHCPLYSHCHTRLSGKWCPNHDKMHIARLLDSEQFNLSDYGFIECGRCGGIIQMVAMLTQRWLKEGRVRCPPVPTELVSLADEQRPVEIRKVPLKTCHGAVWGSKKEWVIQLEDGGTSTGNRFTVFHEAFHILAHCGSNITPVFRKRGGTQGSFNELLADFFAIFILIPQEWVGEKWAEARLIGCHWRSLLPSRELAAY